MVREILAGVASSVVMEDYPSFGKGPGTTQMTKRTKFIHVGKYVAEVDVDLIESDDDWSPYLSVIDACKLDDVRALLANGQVEAAAQQAQVFELTPVATAN